jgi:hypothetical protein
MQCILSSVPQRHSLFGIISGVTWTLTVLRSSYDLAQLFHPKILKSKVILKEKMCSSEGLSLIDTVSFAEGEETTLAELSIFAEYGDHPSRMVSLR